MGRCGRIIVYNSYHFTVSLTYVNITALLNTQSILFLKNLIVAQLFRKFSSL